MTEQYQEQDINGSPSPLSLIAQITGPAIPGAIDGSAIFWASLATDAVIVGNGIGVAGSAALGSIIQFTEPGLYSARLVTSDAAAGAAPLNLLRGVAVAITAGNGYPSADFALVPGVEDVSVITLPAPDNDEVSSIFRITGPDLVDPTGGINPNRQVRFAYVPPLIPTLVPAGTLLTINRISR